MVGRVAGVAGRTVSEGAEVIANGTEEFGGNWSDAFVDTASLHPLKGLKSVGSSVITVGKGIYNLSKLAVSGTFGVLYEFVDECKYIIVPNTTAGGAYAISRVRPYTAATFPVGLSSYKMKDVIIEDHIVSLEERAEFKKQWEADRETAIANYAH